MSATVRFIMAGSSIAHGLPAGVRFFALPPAVSAAALMAATDLVTRKDDSGIYVRGVRGWQRFDGPMFMGRPVLCAARVTELMRSKELDAPAFRSLYMCDPLPEDFPEVPPAALMGERACRECGCTEFNACRHPDHGNCWWVKPDLCSHCENGWGDVS
jgi:hypothetical protein